jgi:hypothetical protein
LYVWDFPLLTFKLSLRCLFSPHHVNQGGVQKTNPQVTLYKPHTAKESLGDAELAGTDRYCLVMRAKRRNCGIVTKESPVACVDDHLVLHSCCNMPPIHCVDS